MTLLRRRTFFAALLPVLLAGSGVIAQSIPGGFERGPELPQPDLPIAQPRISVDLPPGVRPNFGAENETVEVSAITFTGNKEISSAEIEAVTRPLISRETKLSALYGAAQAITRLYAERGLFLSFAYFPAQTVEDGRYQIVIVEGRIGRVRINGLDGSLGARIERRLSSLADSALATLPKLERALLLARDLGGVELSATIEPGENADAPDQFDLVVDGKSKPISALVSLDNRGSKYAGPGRVYSEFSYVNLLGQAETLKIRALGTSDITEQKYGNLELALPLGDDGWLLSMAGGHTISHAGYDLSTFDLRSRSTTADLTLSYPLLRTVSDSLWLSGGFHLVNLRAFLQHSELYTDRTRSVSLAATWETEGPFDGRTRSTVRVDRYVSVFAASLQSHSPTSRHDSNNTATRLTADIVHVQRLVPDLDLVLQGTGQTSDKPLYSLDKFAPGGARFGRAYDSGEISGNMGLAGSAELRLSVEDFLPEGLRGHLYGFYDSAVIWDKRIDGKISEALHSGGGGIRLDWGNGGGTYFEFAQPFGRSVATEAPRKFGRVFLGVTLTY